MTVVQEKTGLRLVAPPETAQFVVEFFPEWRSEPFYIEVPVEPVAHIGQNDIIITSFLPRLGIAIDTVIDPSGLARIHRTRMGQELTTHSWGWVSHHPETISPEQVAKLRELSEGGHDLPFRISKAVVDRVVGANH